MKLLHDVRASDARRLDSLDGFSSWVERILWPGSSRLVVADLKIPRRWLLDGRIVAELACGVDLDRGRVRHVRLAWVAENNAETLPASTAYPPYLALSQGFHGFGMTARKWDEREVANTVELRKSIECRRSGRSTFAPSDLQLTGPGPAGAGA